MAGRWRQVRTQAELDAVLKDGDYAEISAAGYYRASGSATVRASGSATVRAFDSATVEAFGSATVEAFGSATVEAFGSATVRASDSATVRAFGSATVQASDSATVEATPWVAVHQISMRSTVTGGVVITPPDMSEPKNWLAYYGVEVKRGYATLYKLVGDDFKSSYGTYYTPGSEPEAADFAPTNACGGGLHFSPRPSLARRYSSGTRFVACRVRVADMVVIGDGVGADKCKAPRCSVLFECDVDGIEVATVAEVAS